MIKVILFDCDGPIIKREMYFSQRLGIPYEKLKDFFEGDFLLCETGKKDLKEELKVHIKSWGVSKSLDELMDFWFSNEAEVDRQMTDQIFLLRQRGIKCFLATNNEKYRTEYLWTVVGLKNFLDGLFSSCYVGYMKSHAEFWQEAYKNFSEISKQEILVVDDDPQNVKSAQQFGFTASLYTDFENHQNYINEILK